MIDKLLLTPIKATELVSSAARQKRLSLDLTQQTLSDKSGVSYAVIKKFELTGKISLESLLKIAFTLNCLDDFLELFKIEESLENATLDELLKEKKRKRGSK